MREVCLCLVLAFGVPVFTQQAPPPEAGARAEARAALGGMALDDVRTISIRGRSSRSAGVLVLAADMEIHIALPDRYLRIDRFSLAGRASEAIVGLSGGKVIQEVSGVGGLRIDPAARLPEEARAAVTDASARALRLELGLLLLGLFAESGDAYPLELTPGGVAEWNGARAEILDVRGQDFAGRLLIDSRSRLPLMVTWTAPDAAGAAQRLLASRDSSSPTLTPDALLAQLGPPVEHRLYFLEYRRAGAVTWPHRVRRSAGGSTVEELEIDRFEINPDFPPATFERRP